MVGTRDRQLQATYGVHAHPILRAACPHWVIRTLASQIALEDPAFRDVILTDVPAEICTPDAMHVVCGAPLQCVA